MLAVCTKGIMIWNILLLFPFVEVFCKSGFLENLENSELHAVRLRFEEEKAQRLLLQNDVSMMMLKLVKLERQLTTSHEGCVIQTGRNISFHASLSTESHPQMAKEQIIVFDKVVTNHGNGYSPSSGTFRALVSGTYYISVNILTPSHKNIHAGLFVNGEQKVKFYAGGNDGWSSSATQSLVISLDTGDEVFLKVTREGYLHGYDYANFNGFLIH